MEERYVAITTLTIIWAQEVKQVRVLPLQQELLKFCLQTEIRWSQNPRICAHDIKPTCI